MQKLNCLMKGICFRFLNAGQDSVQDQGCQLKNKKTKPVIKTLKPDAVILSRP